MGQGRGPAVILQLFQTLLPGLGGFQSLVNMIRVLSRRVRLAHGNYLLFKRGSRFPLNGEPVFDRCPSRGLVPLRALFVLPLKGTVFPIWTVLGLDFLGWFGKSTGGPGPKLARRSCFPAPRRTMLICVENADEPAFLVCLE